MYGVCVWCMYVCSMVCKEYVCGVCVYGVCVWCMYVCGMVCKEYVCGVCVVCVCNGSMLGICCVRVTLERNATYTLGKRRERTLVHMDIDSM